MSPKPRREPHVMVAAMIGENSKLAGLPNDTARLGYFYVVLGKAKLQRPAGHFASRGHWREVAGRFARYLPQYMTAELIEEAPDLCKRCAPKWPGIVKGALVVHDWHDHQSDPGAAERAAEWRKEHAYDEQPAPEWEGIEQASNADRTSIERGSNSDRTAIQRSLGVHSRAGARGEHEQEHEHELIRTVAGNARAPESTDGCESWLAGHGAMRGQLTAGLSSKTADLVERHGEAAVLAAFEAIEGDRVTAREYIFGAENALNRAHLGKSNGKAPTRSLSDTDFDAGMVGAEAGRPDGWFE
jgi:hypothetical protein